MHYIVIIYLHDNTLLLRLCRNSWDSSWTEANWQELFLCHWMKTGYIIGIYTFLGNVRRSSWLLESSVFHFLNSVYFIPHPRISERKTICLSLKTYFWRGNIRKRVRVLLVYERHASSSWCAEAGSLVQPDSSRRLRRLPEYCIVP